uniref:Uncharacterized protein n=1 Tax=Arundo donax TaxID=35708 RepID=A0A0A9TKR8_ARUDO
MNHRSMLLGYFTVYGEAITPTIPPQYHTTVSSAPYRRRGAGQT